MAFKCVYSSNCKTRNSNPSMCKQCQNNTMRNYVQDHFRRANDNPIPEECPRLTFAGPAEQTAGYKCPVCGTYTNPYAMEKNLCSGCGYELNCV